MKPVVPNIHNIPDFHRDATHWTQIITKLRKLMFFSGTFANPFQ